jgi:hypothetical protein
MTTEIPERCYDLNGVTLTIEGDQQQIGFLDPILGLLAGTDRKLNDWVVKLVAVCEVEPPSQMSRIIWEGPLPENLESVFSEYDNNRTLFVAQHYNMTIETASRSCVILFTSEGKGSIGGTGAFWLLGEILAAEDRFLLHAACMIEPQSDEAFVLFAPSGTGKTTTALTLASKGLSFAGDDALVLEIYKNAPYVWSIPRGLKVDRRTADMLPWLGPALKEWDSEEQLMNLDELGDLIPLASPARRRCAAVIVLKKPNLIAHEIKPISKADAATHILLDNLRRHPGGVDANGRATFAAVARLLANTATLSLSMGPKPDTFHHEMIFDVINSIPKCREQD